MYPGSRSAHGRVFSTKMRGRISGVMWVTNMRDKFYARIQIGVSCLNLDDCAKHLVEYNFSANFVDLKKKRKEKNNIMQRENVNNVGAEKLKVMPGPECVQL